MMFHQQVFNKAKIKIAFAGIFVCLFFFAGIIGCKKDLGQDPDKPFNAASQDRSEEVNPTVTHGMLHFGSFADLSAFTQSLQNREADTTQVRSAYTALGINVNAETIPNITDYPVCLLKEQAIGGYTSARKTEETIINTALDNGNDNINSVVIFPFWKTALNADRAVHVGNRIYKYYDNGGIAIVLNDDWTLYNTVKSQTFESLRESFNLIVTSDAREGWDKYFTFNTDESINTAKPIFMSRFSAGQTTDGKFAIANISLVETTAGAATFTWIYSDNTSSTGQNPNRTVGSTEALTVIVDNGSGTKDTLIGAESILACSTDNFTITPLGNNQFRFELPGYNPSDPTNMYTIRWVFSDGSTSTSNPVVKTFTSNGSVTCQLIRKDNGMVACEFTKTFVAKCGDKKTKTQTFIFNNAGGSGQKWKLDCSIWVLSGEVGCKSKYLKRVAFAWLPANNQGACADISGTYKRQVNTPATACLDITASGSKCLGNGTFPTSVSFTIPEVTNVFREPSFLTSGHRIKVNGVWMGPGTGSMPRLILD